MHFATLHHYFYYYPNKLGNTTLSYSELSLIALLGQHYSIFCCSLVKIEPPLKRGLNNLRLKSHLCLHANLSLQELSMGMDEKTPMQGPAKALH